MIDPRADRGKSPSLANVHDNVMPFTAGIGINGAAVVLFPAPT
jgi:hypothetical protein